MGGGGGEHGWHNTTDTLMFKRGCQQIVVIQAWVDTQWITVQQLLKLGYEGVKPGAPLLHQCGAQRSQTELGLPVCSVCCWWFICLLTKTFFPSMVCTLDAKLPTFRISANQWTIYQHVPVTPERPTTTTSHQGHRLKIATFGRKSIPSFNFPHHKYHFFGGMN